MKMPRHLLPLCALLGIAILAGTSKASADSAGGLEAWRVDQFGANASNAAIAGNQADPDADSLSNLVEYALGLDPNQPSGIAFPAGATETISGTEYLTLTYQKLRTDITYQVEASPDLLSWTPLADTTAGFANGIEMRKAMTPRSAERNFLRLNIAAIPAPAAPSGLAAIAAGSSQINLSWIDNSNDETGFLIERKTGAGGAYAQIATPVANSTSYQDIGLTAATAYTYRVRATRLGIVSSYSGEASATTAIAAPTAPDTLTATANSTTQITLGWADNSGNETGFKIERKTGSGGAYTQIATVGAGVTTYQNTGLSVFTTYYYRVSASNAGGDSAPSAEASATTLDTIPAVPSGLALSGVTSNQVTLKWTDNSNGATGNETSFKIERRTGTSGFFAQIDSVGANVLTYVDHSVASATNYYYRVKASNSGGDSAGSNTPSTTTPGTAVAAPGTLTVVPADSDKMNLSWTDASTNETGFIIERSPTGGLGTFVQVGTVGAGVTTFQDTGLAASKTYYYRVRATNGGTDNSPYTSNVSAKTYIPAPGGLTLQVVSNTQVRLSWTDNSSNETSFSIERKIGADGTYAQTGSVSANVTTYVNSTLSTDTDYYYRVRVPQVPFGSSSDKSIYSNEVHVILLPSPALTAVATAPGEIDLSWTDTSPNEAGFKLERRSDTGGAFTEIATLGANVTTYADTGLPADSTYIYRVRAYRDALDPDAGGASDYSTVANATTQFTGLPSPWLDQDIGTVATIGDSGFSAGAFMLEGSGSDIWGTADNFHYTYQPLSGDGTIVARVTGLEHTNVWAKTGVMIRETLTSGSKHASMVITPGYGSGTSFQYRDTTGGTSTSITPDDDVEPPGWVKLVRDGSRFTAYKSSNGATWVSVGAATISMANDVFIGLPVCSHSTNSCRAVLDNVQMTPGSQPALPTPPSKLTTTPVSASRIDLSWTDNSSNESGFNIERKLGVAGTYAAIGTVAAGVKTYSDVGLSAGTTYYYRVQACNAGGNSDYGVEAAGTTMGGATPSLLSEDKPATASTSASSNQPASGNDGDLTGTRWAASTSAYPQWWRVDLGTIYPLTKVVIDWYTSATRSYKYKIEVSTDDATYTTVVDKTSNAAFGSTTDQFSAAGRYVRITMTGSNSAANTASFYECRVYRTGLEPAAASALTATAAGANQINLAWTDNATNESGFKIERRTGSASGSAYVQVATVGANVTTYQDTGRAAGTQYYYRVMATSDVEGDSLGGYSNEASAKTSVAGAFTRKYWLGVAGGDVSDLTSDARYPKTPTGSNTLNTFESPFDWTDNYGEMVSGLVHPPTDGVYTFWISSKDAGELWLSTDSDPSHAALIAKVEDKAKVREWFKHTTQVSAAVSLQAGESYYIKAIHKESTGSAASSNGDHLAVAWQGPGFSRQVLADTGSPLRLSITSPADGAQIPEGSNITINADPAAGTGRRIVKVEFLLNGDSKVEATLGQDTAASYSFTWNNVAAGSYTLSARAWDDAGVSATSSVKVMVTNPSFGSGSWSERILNGDGSINWTEYANVANHYDRRDIVEYRFGPSYGYFHATPETFPTLSNQSGENGVIGHPYIAGTESDWYSEGGQLIFSPNASASAANQSGVAQAINGDCYTFNGASPEYCFINGIQWNPGKTMDISHGQQVPDPSVKQAGFIAANGGTVPPPIATVRTGGAGGITGFLLFKNGFITGAGNGATDSYYGSGYAYTQLDAGKVPTAGAVTTNTEFLLVTVWDTINHKGQLAVVSLDGQIRAQQSASTQEYFWGHPNRFKVIALKVLGYIDLPFNAPSAISVSNDMLQKDGVGATDNIGLSGLLNSQAERDRWYAWTGDYKKTPKSGYAVIASRAENKVAFIDLQPLFEYYRQMYFTTQANYDQTKNQGTGPDRWPFTFSYAPQQMPVLYATRDVTAPTAVFAGLPQNPNGGAGTTDAYKTNAYITTMAGQLCIYNIGDLITTASGGSIGTPAIIPIGKNPCAIDNNVEVRSGTVITCRGDRSVYLVNSAGTIISVLRDSRIQDPIYTALSQNGRGAYGMSFLHVMDFEGAQIQTYRRGGATSVPPTTEMSGFEFTHTDPLPGCPIMYTRCGVN